MLPAKILFAAAILTCCSMSELTLNVVRVYLG